MYGSGVLVLNLVLRLNLEGEENEMYPYFNDCVECNVPRAST